MLYLSKTFPWHLQTFLTPIASVRNVSITSECFFNFRFKESLNNRTNPQGDGYFKASDRRLQEMMMTLQCTKKKVYVCS